MDPPVPGNGIPINYTSPFYRRRLQDIDSDGFKKFNIYLDFENLKEEIKAYNLSKYQEVIISCMKKAANIFISLLKVKSLTTRYYFSDENLKKNKINYWEKDKFGDDAYKNNKNLLSLGIDLVIFSRIETFGGSSSILAAASSIFEDNKTRQPIAGLVNINPQFEFSKKGIEEYLTSILVHELTHVLGFGEYFFGNFHFNSTKIDEKYGIKKSYLRSPKLINVAKKYFNCNDIYGIELENDGGEGTIGSHWKSRILLGEYMCGTTRSEELVISEFTLAYLEDTGFYKANYYTGGLMRYGKNKGCEFLKEKCVNNYEIKPEFENEFFDSIYYEEYDPSCTSGRLGRAYNFLTNYTTELPTYYQYFGYSKTGGYSIADYCPVPRKSENEVKLNFFSGRCSELGDGTYGSFISYIEKWREGNRNVAGYRYYNNSYLETITGEKYSDHSFCFLSSLTKKTEEKYEIFRNKTRAVCFESFCSSKSLTVKIHENYIVCPRAGGKIELDEYGGYLLCPDYNLICTGTILCNNMFDCVDKQSEIKNDTYNYDYAIKTSQNIENADIATADNETNYELSEDGECPLNCKQCLENKKCIKCRKDFELVGTKNEEKMECIQKDKLKTGYYFSDSIYYKCIEFCEKCTDDTSCENCLANYTYFNNFCMPNIQNCEEYNNNKKCKKCSENYALDADNNDKCISKEEINDLYYTKDNGNSYYLCNGEGENHIQNCSKCSYNSNNNIKLECNECQNGFVILDNESNKCYSKEKMNEKEYYYINQTHIKKCSNNIIHCNECESDEKCTKCEKGFYLLNNEGKKCYNIDEITPINEYYLDENNISYYSCNDAKFNSIENCKECNKKDSCSLCKEGYTFINGDKSKCYEISTLNTESQTIGASQEILNTESQTIGASQEILNTESGIVETNKDILNTESGIVETSQDILNTESGTVVTSQNILNTESENVVTTQDILNNESGIVGTSQDTLNTESENVVTTQDILNTESGIVGTSQDTLNTESENVVTTQDILNTESGIVGTSQDILNTESGIVGTSQDIFNTESGAVETSQDTLNTESENVVTTQNILNTESQIVLTSQDILNTESQTVVESQDTFNTESEKVVTSELTVNTESEKVETSQLELNTESEKVETSQNALNTESEKVEASQVILNTESDKVGTSQDIFNTESGTVEASKDILNTESQTVETNQDILNTESQKVGTSQDISNTESQKVGTSQDISNTESQKVEASQIKLNTESQTILTTIPKSQIISTIMTTSIKPTEPSNQTAEIESPFNIITIILLQVKLKDNQLYLYLLIDSFVPNSFSFKIKINIYSRKILRNLQETKKEMEINITPLNYTSSSSFGGLYTFVPDQTFKEYLISEGENVRIEVTNITPNIYDNKYEYNVEMGDNPDYLDTAKIEQILQNNHSVDYSQAKNVNIFHLESVSQGCSFELTTKEQNEVYDKKLNLEFQEIKSHKNESIACYLKRNTNIINCNLEEVVNNNYTFNNYIEFNSYGLLSIISNKENIFPMSCFFKYNKFNTKSSSLSKGVIALIIIIPIIAIIIVFSLSYFLFIKSKSYKNNTKDRETPTIRNLVPDSAIDNLE